MMATNQTNTYVAGRRGMVGSAIVRRLRALGHAAILTADRRALDLLDQAAVRRFFAQNRIDIVYLAAAKVGGIHANDAYPAEFIHENPAAQLACGRRPWPGRCASLAFER